MRKPVYIIAEAGVNHNGDHDVACQLVEAAAKAGADAIKFQTFKAEELVTAQANKAAYQKETTGSDESQLEMLRKLELNEGAHDALIACCEQHGIEFLSTPFDGESLDMLLEMGVSRIKVPSGEITNLPYLRYVGSKGKQVIVSTGMTSLQEVRDAVTVLEQSGTSRAAITLLHCNTQYPTPFADANLEAIRTLCREFPDCQIGYSDHTAGISCPVAATALGAVLVEKHFTLDRTMEGPDHAASLQPDELTAMVRGIREIEEAMGDGVKQATPSEQANVAIARRYLVAATPIKEGEPFTPENVAAKRTGAGGLSPMMWDEVMASKAPRSFTAGECIEL